MQLRPDGALFVFEGPDDVGKSTLAQDLVTTLNEQGIPSKYLAFPGSEEGSLGRHIYRLHHEPSQFGITSIDPTSLQILHIAAHIDTIHRYILPSLSLGMTIVLDRFWWSTYVYGRALGSKSGAIDEALKAELYCWADIRPRIVFLVNRGTRTVSWAEKRSRDNLLNRLTDEYKKLASVEGSKYPVIHISNDGSIEEARARLLASLVRLE